jgi:hypothetical protein
MKGKGLGPSFSVRSRSSLPGNRPYMTRLTRTMGFVEMSQLSGVAGSIGTPDAFDPEIPGIETTSH